VPDLDAELEDAAFQVGHDVSAAAAAAAVIAGQAAERGDLRLRQRARLVLADAAGRRGQPATLGIMAREILAWGLAHDDPFLVARAHRLLSTFYEGLGDGGSSLEHALAAVHLLPADASFFFKGDHETRLGNAHLTLRAFDAARERFEQLMRWAQESGDDNLRLRTLNNLAFLEHLAGRGEESVRLSRDLLEHSRRSGIMLSAAAWDTVARAQMSAGNYVEAERTLLGALAGEDHQTEVSDVADLHVSIATCQRMLGRFEDAAASLDVADAQWAERDLGNVRSEAIEERSTLAAATGDYRAAYELYREFHALKLELLSAAKDARARILAAVFETDEAVRAKERYREMSEHDHLTGLHNRRYAEMVVPQLLQAAARDGEPLSLAIADLDHFKWINDTYSHQAGDEVLQRFSQLLQAACPPGGLVARLGGEEFLLVLPDHDVDQARQICENLRQAASDHDWSAVVGELRVTVSLGLADVSALRPSLLELLAEADRRLYQAKRTGRNRVVGAAVPDAGDEPEPASPSETPARQVPLARRTGVRER
jgi:diguanylate cyclase (GGDEF)-like protein